MTNPIIVHAVLLDAVVRKDGVVNRRFSRNKGDGEAKRIRVIKRRQAVDEMTSLI